MKRASNLDALGVPIIMPTVEIQIDQAGSATVTVDKEPYETPKTLRRDGVRQLVQDLANDYGPIRVMIVEADGEAYVDIETPRDQPADPSPRLLDRPLEQRSKGPFQQDEDVLVAVIVDRCSPDSDGAVFLGVPPAIAQRYGNAVYLIGQTSHAVVPLAEVERERL